MMMKGMLTNVTMQGEQASGSRRQQNEGKAKHGLCGLGMGRRARDFLKNRIPGAC
jgi:hypothetical protein